MLRENNTAFKWVITGTAAVLCLVLTIPFLKNLFHFGAVSLNDVFLALAGGIIAVAIKELMKVIPYERVNEHGT
jgi:Ca2+-transporting ATPase